jgi:hypothetical protein
MPKPWDFIILFVINILIVLPLFIIIHQNIIDLDWPFHLDRILIFSGLIALFQYFFLKIRKFVIISTLIYLGTLIYGITRTERTFESVFQDYSFMLYAMAENPNPEEIILSKVLPFPNKKEILKAIEYQDPRVRNFAVFATKKHFKQESQNLRSHRNFIQYFAVFKEIHQKWDYVNDPKSKQYIAKATESLIHFSGDCDDHSILMVSCIRAIGGVSRLVHTNGHIYPELFIGDKKDLETVNYLIREVLFKEEIKKSKGVYYHEDERGNIWLNLDYTAKYPGGPFLHPEILGVLVIE